MLGGKGRSLVVTGTFCLTAGFSFHNYYLILIGIFFLFATFVSLPNFVSSMNIEQLAVTREMDNKRVFRDDFVHIVVTIENRALGGFDFLDIFDEFPTDVFRLVTGENYISTRIEPKQTIQFSYVLAPKVRGEFELGPLTVTVRDRLGFNAETRVVPNSFSNIIIVDGGEGYVS